MGHVDRRAVRWAAGALVLACLIVLTLFRAALGRAVVAEVIGLTTHTKVSFGSMHLTASYATFTDVSVRSRRGEPIADIRRVDVTYDPHDLLPGGHAKRLFGLYAIDADQPHITVIHRRDGSYNIPALKMGGGNNPNAPPMAFTARVRNGSLTILDATRVDPAARHLSFDGFNAAADINTKVRSHYTVSFNYLEGGRRYPLRGVGDVDPRSGYLLHRWTIAKIPIALLVDYVVNSPTLHFAAGDVTAVDARYFGLADAHGTMHDRIAATAFLQHVRLYIGGLSKPLRDVQGRLDAYGDGLAMQSVEGTIAGIPVHIAGGMYGLKHPTLRLAVTGHGDLGRLRRLFAAAAQLPMTGPLDFSLMAEGPATAPVTLISLRSPQVVYNAVPFDDPHGLIAFDGHEADIIGFGAGYDGMALDARGRIALRPQPDAVRMLLHADAPADRVPYAAQVLPGMILHGTGLATGNDPKLIDMQGLLLGNSPTQRFTGTFRVDSRGVGVVGPFTIGGAGGSLFGRVQLDHPHAKAIALVDARALRFRPAPAVPLPGFNLPALPPLAGTLDGRLLGSQDGPRFGLIGSAHLHDARVGAAKINAAGARFGGELGGIQVSTLDARGPWGSFDGAGSILFGSDETIAQVRDARFSPAGTRAIPVQALNATIGTHGKAVRIYAAHATVAGGDAIAAGSAGSGGLMAFSATGLDLASMRTAGVPLQAGHLSLAVTIGGATGAPNARGSVLLDRARYQRYPIGADAAFAYAGDTLNVHDATIGLGPAFVGVDGSVSGLRIGGPFAPRYDVNAKARSVDAHALAALLQPGTARTIQGSIDADIHVRGSGAAPSVVGLLRMPHGSVRGLAFRDLAARVRGNPRVLALDAGRVLVGSTALAFDARLSPGEAQLAVRAPQADLADFNDFFDTADTLGGHGQLIANIDIANGRIESNGDAAFTGTRFRRFDIGNAIARWHTAGRTLYANADVGGVLGQVHLGGAVAVADAAAAGSLSHLVTQSDVDMKATVRGMNLTTWLPMLGLDAPVTGYLDADTAVRGHVPNLTTATTASLRDGTAGHMQISRLRIAAATAADRGTITSVILETPFFTATGSGSFGVGTNQSLDLSAHGTAPDIGALLRSATGQVADLGGALDTTLRIAGTRAQPRLSDEFTLSSLRVSKLTIPRVSGQLALDQHSIELHNGEIDLQRGQAKLAGRLPVQLSPFAIGPADAPVSLALTAEGVDVSNATALLPKGARATGRVDGSVALSGTVGAPRITGALALANGTFVGPSESVPITNGSARLTFTGTAAQLRNAHANVGGGTIDAAGAASMPNVYNPQTLAFRLDAKAHHPRIDAPAYFKGRIDGAVSAVRSPGQQPMVAGNLAVSDARIPLSALFNPNAQRQPQQPPPEVGLNLALAFGKDVRIQSPNVDIGGEGAVIVGGTTRAPSLDGSFTSTGGTVSFFREFRLENGSVAFDPSSGIIPTIDAVAATRVTNPDTDITLHVTGPATGMNVEFSSEPAYDREQILGLLAGAQGIGAVPGVASTGESGNFSAAATTQQLALSGVNQVFTRNLLEPLSSALGSSLGFQNLQLFNDLSSGFGANAVKAFGKDVDLVASESFGIAKRDSFALNVRPNDATAIELMVYDQQQTQGLAAPESSIAGLDLADPSAASLQLMTGTNGFALSLKRALR